MTKHIRLWRTRLVTSALLAVALTIAAMPGGAAAAQPKLTKYSITVNPGNFSNLAEFVGARMKIFQKYGIDPQLINSTSTALTLQLLQTNQLNFGSLGVTPVILAQKTTGTGFRFVTQIAKRSPSQFLCRKDSGVLNGYSEASLRSMYGKTVAFNAPTSPSVFVLREAFRRFGLDFNQIKPLYVSGASAITAALTSGRIDCGLLVFPAGNLLGSGYVIPLNFLKKSQSPPDAAATGVVLAVTDKFAASHKEGIIQMQKAMTHILNYLGNPANASKIATAVAGDFVGFQHDVLASLIQGVAAGLYLRGAAVSTTNYRGAINQYNDFAWTFGEKPIRDAKYKNYVLPQPSFMTEKTGYDGTMVR